MRTNFRRFSLVLSALAVLALTVAGCGSASDSKNPTEAMGAALEKTATVTSGKVAIDGAVSVGNLPGSIALKGGGVFDTKAGKGGALDLQFEAQIAGTEQKIGLVAVDGKNYVVFGDKALEQRDQGNEPVGSESVADFIKSLGEHLTDVKRTADNTYTAEVDFAGLTEKMDKEEGGIGGFSIPGLGSGESIAKNVSQTEITVTVDDAGYATKMDINLDMQADGQQGGIRVSIELSEIDQPQKIKKPKTIVTDPSALDGFGAMLSQMQ